MTGLQEYKSACADRLRGYFDGQGVVARANLDFMHKGWTVNFGEEPGPNQIQDIKEVS